jgi:hypothetical protein
LPIIQHETLHSLVSFEPVFAVFVRPTLIHLGLFEPGARRKRHAFATVVHAKGIKTSARFWVSFMIQTESEDDVMARVLGQFLFVR